jgi:poly [ADP-ribose] polymerase
MASKSLAYCHAMNKTALILLCEVALGNMNELTTTNSNADKLPSGKHSTKGCGITFPDESQKEFFNDYLEIPKGLPIRDKENKVNIFYIVFLIFLCYIFFFTLILDLSCL